MTTTKAYSIEKDDMKDTLGDRMKIYESVTQNYLTKRCLAIVRLDGRGFHKYTQKIKADKPFDLALMNQMDETAIHVCKNISATFAYVQSDEISLLLSDIENINKQFIFDGNVQKIVSITASTASVYFNSIARKNSPLATFDSRVYNISDPVEVYNYFLWRTRDWERNSIQMFSRNFYSHKELQGKKMEDMHEMLHNKGKNWAKLPEEIKRGRIISKDENGKWISQAMFNLPEEKNKLQSKIPVHGYEY